MLGQSKLITRPLVYQENYCPFFTALDNKVHIKYKNDLNMFVIKLTPKHNPTTTNKSSVANLTENIILNLPENKKDFVMLKSYIKFSKQSFICTWNLIRYF